MSKVKYNLEETCYFI